MEDLGKVLYEAFFTALIERTKGQRASGWNKLLPNVQESWRIAAEALIKYKAEHTN